MTKASDNAFPSVLITEGTEPSAPAAGKQRLYIDSTSHHLSRTDESGADVDLETNQAGGGLGAWTDFTPTWTAVGTAPALGDGILTGRYKALDANTYAIQIFFEVGSTSTMGTGQYGFSGLPATAKATTPKVQTLSGYLLNTGTSFYVVTGKIDQGATVVDIVVVADMTGTKIWAAGGPFALATGDQMVLAGILEV